MPRQTETRIRSKAIAEVMAHREDERRNVSRREWVKFLERRNGYVLPPLTDWKAETNWASTNNHSPYATWRLPRAFHNVRPQSGLSYRLTRSEALAEWFGLDATDYRQNRLYVSGAYRQGSDVVYWTSAEVESDRANAILPDRKERAHLLRGAAATDQARAKQLGLTNRSNEWGEFYGYPMIDVARTKMAPSEAVAETRERLEEVAALLGFYTWNPMQVRNEQAYDAYRLAERAHDHELRAVRDHERSVRAWAVWSTYGVVTRATFDTLTGKSDVQVIGARVNVPWQRPVYFGSIATGESGDEFAQVFADKLAIRSGSDVQWQTSGGTARTSKAPVTRSKQVA